MSRTNRIYAQERRTLRFRVDYWKLKAVTNRDSYFISRVDERINRLGDVAIFSKFDINCGSSY